MQWFFKAFLSCGWLCNNSKWCLPLFVSPSSYTALLFWCFLLNMSACTVAKNRCSRFRGWSPFQEITIMVYLGPVYRYLLFRYAVFHFISRFHLHICICTIMSTNEPFSQNKNGWLIQSQPLCKTCFSQYQAYTQAYTQAYAQGLHIHNTHMWMYIHTCLYGSNFPKIWG